MTDASEQDPERIDSIIAILDTNENPAKREQSFLDTLKSEAGTVDKTRNPEEVVREAISRIIFGVDGQPPRIPNLMSEENDLPAVARFISQELKTMRQLVPVRRTPGQSRER